MASKRYRKAHEMIDREKRYELEEAVALLKSTPSAKFDETIEVHMNLGVDPRKADQQIRNSLVLPHGTGRTSTVLVFAEGEKADEAKEAGADYVGLDEYIEKINSGWTDFDVVISTPNLMGKIGRLGRVLGPRGLMPNPKVGTVTMDVAKAVNEAKGGKVTYRVDKLSNLHIIAGKKSFEAPNLKDNLLAIIVQIIRERPSALKGTYIKNLAVTSTMGPSIKIDLTSVKKEIRK
ncbi:MAG: 50S ribosomal protein L1 [Candidatus Cloacimonetes bacterium]|jgi:large subunit ribosomal protein L1|nr:50S ribosomal protein L1 [Candidatus Cloacimonadota bacterium]MBT6993443.1 50S ribosomal protein L1 [Candidatus Cloacimonadota bacterium]MBT7469563.1 50S ribosomal protein L1 [Candidatus Cloacimonadota bacterium]